MINSSKIKISRAGKILGDFSREEIIEGLNKGTFSPKDYFWDPQYKDLGWQNLSSLLPAGAVPAPTPPAPPKRPPENKPIEMNEPKKDWGIGKTMRFILAVIFILGGLAEYSSGASGNPDGSAIRQAVLAQWQTNGLLLVIIGFLIGRK